MKVFIKNDDPVILALALYAINQRLVVPVGRPTTTNHPLKALIDKNVFVSTGGRSIYVGNKEAFNVSVGTVFEVNSNLIQDIVSRRPMERFQSLVSSAINVMSTLDLSCVYNEWLIFGNQLVSEGEELGSIIVEYLETSVDSNADKTKLDKMLKSLTELRAKAKAKGNKEEYLNLASILKALNYLSPLTVGETIAQRSSPVNGRAMPDVGVIQHPIIKEQLCECISN